MRGRLGTIEAISRLVVSGDIQTGFKRLCELGLKDWTIESAVMKFPGEFSREARECADFRLHLAEEDFKLGRRPSWRAPRCEYYRQ